MFLRDSQTFKWFFNSNKNAVKNILSYLPYFQHPDDAFAQLPLKKSDSTEVTPHIWMYITYEGWLLEQDVYGYCQYQMEKENMVTRPQN